ncbi:MAG: 5-deoxy-glucuronate isomerase [Gemmatimonadales bacterium]|nr:5-deoxy-glucuronate isomerase [Gemmatimonadales bacterium]NIN12593.1 5-deoxy-glucuronate isomerase [Gemmatimonadales bacterium]NIN50932.1 5-deoxy-glucuronate isomerase [Gemmatimonadales bacterium]NIP08396.1 5-deoxy-glucuronate isomerase [Gemmatimonadales bacterium]NIQ99581.1 5-deoxy-glucuronate isomerase [Gemmatimonadales bacterium]
MNRPSEQAGQTLADTLYRVPRQDGLHQLQQRGDGAARELSSWRLRLRASGTATFQARGEEAVLVLQEGEARVEALDYSWDVGRRGVFEEPATALYVPPGVELTVTASTPAEAIVVTAPADPGGEPVLIEAHQVHVQQRGTGTYRREVHDIFVADDIAQRLMVGETFNPAGNWSSYPPHKHDGRDGEPRLEEVYHYRVDPPQGFGLQSLYTADGESVTHMVRDGDAVLIPYGYHPVCAPPGYRLYYLWALVGEKKALAVYDDPQHSWITET